MNKDHHTATLEDPSFQALMRARISDWDKLTPESQRLYAKAYNLGSMYGAKKEDLVRMMDHES